MWANRAYQGAAAGHPGRGLGRYYDVPLVSGRQRCLGESYNRSTSTKSWGDLVIRGARLGCFGLDCRINRRCKRRRRASRIECEGRVHGDALSCGGAGLLWLLMGTIVLPRLLAMAPLLLLLLLPLAGSSSSAGTGVSAPAPRPHLIHVIVDGESTSRRPAVPHATSPGLDL